MSGQGRRIGARERVVIGADDLDVGRASDPGPVANVLADVVVFQMGGFQDGINIDHELGPLGSSSSSLEKLAIYSS